MNTKEKNSYPDVGFLFYIFTAAITVIFFFCTLALEPKDSVPSAFADKWYTDAALTEKADLKHPDVSTGSCTFYAKVPDSTAVGDCLWFKAKNCFISVFVGDDLRASITASELSYLYGKTSGTSWVCVPLDPADRSELIRIDFLTNYNDNSSYIDSVFAGNTLSSFRFALYDRLFGTVLCILLLFTSAVMVIVYLIVSRYIKNMPKDILYLGCSIFFAALWSMSELRVFQIFTDKNAGIFHNLTCMTLMLVIMPLIYYYKTDLDTKSRLIVPAMTILTVMNFTVSSVLHFTHIADYHETLRLTHITIGVGMLCVIYASYWRCFKNPDRIKADFPPAVAMIGLAVAAIGDIFRYSGGGINDSAFYTRIAIFIYSITLGARSLIYIVNMVKRGMRADIISRLAYEDGLTGLGNRTAFSEKIEQLDGVKTTIFVFDINNLKYVNDNLGHLEGDELIKSGAELISSVFGEAGSCYRIGGDEFVCLASGKLDVDWYNDIFYKRISEFNSSGALNFHLMIAMGSEYYNGSGSIKDTFDAADRRMYSKKAELKQEALTQKE